MRVFLILLLLTSNVHAESVVDIARSQLGLGEIGGNNRGEIVKKYTRGKEIAWCAGFVSWVLNRAGKHTPYILRASNYLRLKEAKAISHPRAGDIIVLKRKHGSGHVGIVESVQGNVITTIEGNVGPYPAKVKRVSYQLGKIKNLIGFVRI